MGEWRPFLEVQTFYHQIKFPTLIQEGDWDWYRGEPSSLSKQFLKVLWHIYQMLENICLQSFIKGRQGPEALAEYDAGIVCMMG